MVRRGFVLLVPLVLGLTACGSSGHKPAKTTTTTEAPGGSTTSSTSSSTSTSSRPGTTSSTTPSGPTRRLAGSGGTGSFTWSVVTDRSEFCYRISLDSHSAAIKATLNRGAAGQSGEVVLQLMPPGADGTVNSCSAGDQILVEEIKAQPSRF